MPWSTVQRYALDSVGSWLRDPRGQQVFRLFGYAGTGKTTLAKYLAEGVGGRVYFSAFTGKATHVLRQSGCPNATTLHSLIYRSKERGRARLRELQESILELEKELRAEGIDPEQDKRLAELRGMLQAERKSSAQPLFSLNPDSDLRGAALVVVDEGSMVDERMGEDLLSFGVPVLVLGDPAQLPPVKGGGYFTGSHTPDVMLTEIHRQARDNPILELATLVRERRQLPAVGSYGESRVVSRIGSEDALLSDQVLVGRNATRRGSNRRLRSLLGLEDGLPVAGDKLVCLRNNHDVGLLNGSLWRAESVQSLGEERLLLSVRSEEGGEPIEVEAHAQHFLGKEENLAWWERREAEEFTYGYALTVHKAQGSQWPNVLLINESSAFRGDWWRWLYTGITRAQEKLTLLLGE